MSELVTMYPAQANSPETSLSGALTAAGTTVNVVDGSVLPEARTCSRLERATPRRKRCL